jgi:hypothetical protein
MVNLAAASSNKADLEARSLAYGCSGADADNLLLVSFLMIVVGGLDSLGVSVHAQTCTYSKYIPILFASLTDSLGDIRLCLVDVIQEKVGSSMRS